MALHIFKTREGHFTIADYHNNVFHHVSTSVHYDNRDGEKSFQNFMTAFTEY